MDNIYFDASVVREFVAKGSHRGAVGGMWDEIGPLQFEFLRQQGLEPHHKLIDVGCGCFRGGVHFVKYLDPGNYYGIDISQELLDAGYECEIVPAGLQQRLPRRNLVCNDSFDLAGFEQVFDFALAQSVFTHLTFNRIRQCLERVEHFVRPGAMFYATFFELPNDVPSDAPFQHHPGDVITHGVADPYHYRVRDFEHAITGLRWSLHYIGDWGHPRAQRMIAFRRLG